MSTQNTDQPTHDFDSRIAIHITMPLYKIKGGKPASALDVVVYKRKLNAQKFGLAFQDNSLLGLRTLETNPANAVQTLGQIFDQQKDIAAKHGLETRQSADLIGTDKVGKMSIRFASSDAGLAHLQAKVSQQIAPIATAMFINRIQDQSSDIPVYTAKQPSHTVTEISVDKPCDPLSVAAYFVGIMGDRKSCRRTLDVLKAHQDSAECASLLFQASKKDIIKVLPDDKKETRGLEVSAHMTRMTPKLQTIYI